MARYLLESIHAATLGNFYGSKMPLHTPLVSGKQNVKNIYFCFQFLTTPRYNQYQAVFFNFVLLKKKVGLGTRLTLNKQ